MEWRGRRESDNVEDIRGDGSTGGGGFGLATKGGLGTIVIALILWGVFGVKPQDSIQIANQVGTAPHQKAYPPANSPEQNDAQSQFVSVILADTEDTWSTIFKEHGAQYQAPVLTLFSGGVRSACGMAQSAMGPFYCPADHKVYLDTTFFNDMHQSLGISGEQNGSGDANSQQAGDFAQAYVIAHEVGHHVQNLMGIEQKVHQMQQQVSEAQANALSVRLELQADCFAGVWANRNQQRVHFLQQGDVEEALDAATQIGDDRLQTAQQGYAVPESFTHGSSQQRVHWFSVGLKTGRIESCNTFGTT